MFSVKNMLNFDFMSLGFFLGKFAEKEGLQITNRGFRNNNFSIRHQSPNGQKNET